MKSCEMGFNNYEEWYDHETAVHPNEIDFWFWNEGEFTRCDKGLRDKAFNTEEKFEAHFQTEHPDDFRLPKRKEYTARDHLC